MFIIMHYCVSLSWLPGRSLKPYNVINLEQLYNYSISSELMKALPLSRALLLHVLTKHGLLKILPCG